MAIEKIDNIDSDDIEKINGIAVSSLEKMNGQELSASPPVASTVCWVAVGADGRIMYSESATAASGSWNDNDYTDPDGSTSANAVAFGKDNNGNEQWIIAWDKGNNLAAVATVSIPSASSNWSPLDLDGTAWGSGKAPADVGYSNGMGTGHDGTSPGLWAIAGKGGRVAYSYTGSTDTDDWKVDVATTTGFASNRHIEGLAFSGSYLFLVGARTRIVSGSVVMRTTPPTGPYIFWGTSPRCLDENDSVGSSQFTWKRIAIAGTGSAIRLWAVADSTRTINFPVVATGSGHACCGDFDGSSGWHDITNYPVGSFGDNSTSAKRKMFDVAGDGKGNWIIVGEKGEHFKSTNNGDSWVKFVVPAAVPPATTNIILYTANYYSISDTDTWIVGGVDGYIAVSTDISDDDNWTLCENPWSAAGTGANKHVYDIAFSQVRNYTGTS